MHAVLHMAAGGRGGRGLVGTKFLTLVMRNLVTVVGKFSVRTFSVKITQILRVVKQEGGLKFCRGKNLTFKFNAFQWCSNLTLVAYHISNEFELEPLLPKKIEK